MFGVPPRPVEDCPRTAGTTIYQASIVGALLFGLGLVCLILAVGLSPQLIESAMSMLVIGLPLVAGSVLGLALGYAHLHTRIEIGAERLEIVAPSWRGFPAPPLQHLSVELEQVHAIRRRIERLGLGVPGLRLPVDVYAIETGRGRVVLAGYYLGELDTALIEIVARAGCARSDEGEVVVGLGRVLFRGGVPFGAGDDRPFSRPRMRVDRPR